MVYRPVRPTILSFVIKVSMRGEVKYRALECRTQDEPYARTQDEPYTPDFLSGEWCAIRSQLREQRKRLRSACSALVLWWLWDPIKCTLILYLVYVLHWLADGYGIPRSAHLYCTLCMFCIGLLMAMGSHKVHTYIVPCACSALAC